MMLGLYACQDDNDFTETPTELETQDHSISNYTVRTFSSADIPFVLESIAARQKGLIPTLEPKRTGNNKSSDSPDNPFGTVDLTVIQALEDKNGNMTYTFRIDPFQKETGIFYNLIVKADVYGVVYYSYIKKYESADGGDFRDDYNGKVENLDLDGNFLNNVIFTEGRVTETDCTDCEEDDPPNDGDGGGPPDDTTDSPDDPVDGDGPNDDTSGGGGPGDGGDDPTGDGPGPGDEPGTGDGSGDGGSPDVICLDLLVTDCGGNNSDTPHLFGSCRGPNGPNGDGLQTYNTILQECGNSNRTAIDPNTPIPCCSETGDDVVVLPPDEEDWQPVVDCVNSNGDNDVTTIDESILDDLDLSVDEWGQIDNYLQDNGCREEAQVFAIEALLTLSEDGEVDWVERIIYTSNFSTCVKSIVKKMIGDNEYVDLGDMPTFVKEELNLSGTILNFFNASNDYNLIFDGKNNLVNTLGQRLNAKTVPERDLNNQSIINFRITLDSDYISNATDLSIARTIIHEILHAYISYIYQDQMFNNLSNSLRELLSEQGATPNSAQHKLMTQQFVTSISNSLESWDNSSLTNQEYYYYLSWSGAMLDSPAFDDLDGNTQQAIEDANIAEGSALSPATGQAQGTNNCN